MRRAALTAAVLMSATLASGSDAADELARGAAYFRDARAHRASFTQTFTPAGFSRSRSESGTVVLQRPDSLRFDYAAPTKKTFAFDGETARFYVPRDRQMTQRTLTPEDRAELPLVFLDDPAKLEKSYTISLESRTDGADLLLRPRSTNSEISWLRLEIRPDGAPKAISYANAAGDRTVIEFGPFETLSPMPSGEFRIKPPPGTRIVQNETYEE
jgi:outer membrane lipoprotein carrier protein